jgi:hypothetical protein
MVEAHWCKEPLSINLPNYVLLSIISMAFCANTPHIAFWVGPHYYISQNHGSPIEPFCMVICWKIFKFVLQALAFGAVCRNPSFGLATKAKGLQGCRPKGSPGVTSHTPGSAKSVREWTLTLPSELPCWELESRKDSRIFRARFQGSKILALKSFLYHWKAIEV